MKAEIPSPNAEATAGRGFRSSFGFRISAFGFCLLLLLSPLHAQPAAPNYVLSLGGTNGFLELLPNDLPTLTESE